MKKTIAVLVLSLVCGYLAHKLLFSGASAFVSISIVGAFLVYQNNQIISKMKNNERMSDEKK